MQMPDLFWIIGELENRVMEIHSPITHHLTVK